MSLAKQLIILISIIFFAIFSVNFYASITNIRDYLQIESEIHAQDTATSLGLSLSPYILEEDNTILETMINAIFDRGYYLSIVLENMKGKELVRKTNPKTFEVVPDWFTALLPMQTVTAESVIDAGWVKGGRIYVTIHPGFGFLKLWEQAKQTLIYSALMLVIFILILIAILQLVLRPLGKIDRLARTIADGNFDTITDLPWTTEIRNIAVSMNFMSGKIEKVISSLNERLEETGKRLRIDELTGLETRGTFETEMKQRFMAGWHGYLFIIKINDLTGYTKKQSSRQVDDFIVGFVTVIREVLKESGLEDDYFYRIIGSEFSLLAACEDQASAEQLCDKLIARLIKYGERHDKSEVAHIGGVLFDRLGTTESMLSSAMEVYEKARMISANAYSISETRSTARDQDQWKAIVKEVIEHKRIEVDFAAQSYSLKPGEEDLLLIEEAIARVYDTTGEPLPIGTFISVAENVGSIMDFDLHMITKVIEHIATRQTPHDVAVNLSFTSLSDNEFRAKLFTLLEEHRDIRNKLVFCVTAYGATLSLESFGSFIDFVQRNGAKVILKRFESRFIPISDLKNFKLDYIRLARAYTEKISRDMEKQHLVKAMKELGDILNIVVLAEAVEDDIDYAMVKEIGLAGASR